MHQERHRYRVNFRLITMPPGSLTPTSPPGYLKTLVISVLTGFQFRIRPMLLMLELKPHRVTEGACFLPILLNGLMLLWWMIREILCQEQILRLMYISLTGETGGNPWTMN